MKSSSHRLGDVGVRLDRRRLSGNHLRSGMPGVLEWIEDAQGLNRKWAGKWLLAFSAFTIIVLVTIHFAG